jgi:4-hydroxybenzoyl-CoA reductase subunit beta
MLRLTPFKYLRPRSVEEAVQLKRELGPPAVYMAGGTDVLVNIKHRLIAPEYVIGLRGVENMPGIRRDPDGWLTIGGNTTVFSIEHSATVQAEHAALAHACSLISTPQVRRTGTIAGNICLDVRCNYYNQSEHWRKAIGYCMKKDSEICRVAPGSDRCWAVSSADSVPVLMTLGAKVKVCSVSGCQWHDIELLYQDDGLSPTILKSDDLITEVRIPPAGSMRTVYSKLRVRLSFDFPLVGVATGIALSEGGVVEEARIVLTAVGSHPIRVVAAEVVLRGQVLTPERIHLAGDCVYRTAKPMDNTEGSIPHRKRMARLFVEKALRDLAGLESKTA